MEKERELELREKLDEQRRVLEGEHEETLQGKDGDALLARVWKRPSFVPTSQFTGGLPLAPTSCLWPLPPTTGPAPCLWLPPPASDPQIVGCFRAGVFRVLGLILLDMTLKLTPCFV